MITSFLRDSDSFKSLTAALESGTVRAYASSYIQGYLLAAVKETIWQLDRVLLVAPSAADASRLTADLTAFCQDTPVRLLPPRGVIIGSGMVPSRQVVGMRHQAVTALGGAGSCVVVTDAASLQEKGFDPGLWGEPLRIAQADSVGFEKAIEDLARLGYERADQVEDRGQFAVRGGIIDVYPSTDPSPLRLEFWGEELESLRRFSPFTQRSLADENEALIYAADEEVAAGKTESSRALTDSVPEAVHLCRVDAAVFPGVVSSFWQDALELSGEEEAARNYIRPGDMERRLEEASELDIESLASDQEHSFSASGFKFASRRHSEAIDRLKRLKSEGYRVFVHFNSEGAARRAQHNFAGQARLLEVGEDLPRQPGAYLVVAPPPPGFVSSDLLLAVFGERALLRPDRAARSQRLALGGKALASLKELSPGDFAVHEDHGIGIFDKVLTKTISGVTRDYLLLRYKDDDALFVPQEQIYRVSRYMGTGDSAPPLNKLGGRAWELARSRARRAAREMAGELLQLYAARQNLPGHEYKTDDQWQLQMEAAFPYIETPDQSTAIEDVKDDMESPHPMDRLICGDVGFGKTEVALRAAFKAATQGKQVLMLVPTTILAMQHFKTFQERFEPYPLKVEMISRFRSQAESRRISQDFREGEIEVLIGTHRLLSTDIIPKDLGLVIIDEEQRFGVAQKEKLRQFRLKVDVLSLTATPIPRTLQMSLSGIRDISIMETPPAGRNPIHTYVSEYDDQLVKQSIGRELERGGQVFFLHNRVETINEKAGEIKSLLPGGRILVAHGQMPEKELESVMVSFLRREADILVCTSIIESGLDIPSANTLIVDRADMLGLAQLYQIRGRIGRSNVNAHAYLFYPPFSTPTRDAMARLSTLSDYTELGSGFRIAMRDLEIRGAGNLLGGEQSGHVAAVGFDMYCDILRKAVAEFSDRPQEEHKVARLDIDVDAYIPGDYIPLETARIDIHHRIAAAPDEEDLLDIKLEMKDRFGPIPDVVDNLVRMQEIRIKAGRTGAAAISYKRGRLELADVKLDSSQRVSLEEQGYEFVYHPLKRQLVLWPRADDNIITVISGILDGIMDSLLLPMIK